MADEVVILRVDTGAAVKSVADLRFNIAEYKKALNEAEIGSAEYREILGELTTNQNALRNAMHASTASLADVSKAAQGIGNSYNALVAQMAKLKEEFRSTNDVARRNELGAQIDGINTKLKNLDAQQGNFGRNVGNYTKSVVDAFSKMGGSVSSVINPIKAATGALDVMGKTPVVAILGLLATVLMKVVSAMNSSEEATNALNKALAPLRALGDAATRTLQALGDVVVKLVDKFTKLTNAIFGTNEATKERIQLAEREAQLAGQSRETTMKNAEAERDAAELRAKAADKATYSAKERLDFLKQAGELEKQIADRNYQDAKLNYEIIKQRNELTKSSKEDLDQEAQAYAAMVNAETSYYEKVRSINSGIARAMKEDATSAAKAVKEMKDAYEVPDFDATLADDDAADWLARSEKAEAAMDKENAAIFANLTKQQEIRDAANAQRLAAEQAVTDAIAAEREKQKKADEEAAKNMATAWKQSVAAVADVMNSLADIYEANANGSAKAENKVKALRIASATISTIQGAIGAYMQSVATIPPPAGIIAGAAQAATVTAAGLAQIAKMRSTAISTSSTATATSAATFPSATATAPVQPIASPASLATLATDTQLLNKLNDQRVYILASDIEASNDARRVQVAETTF